MVYSHVIISTYWFIHMFDVMLICTISHISSYIAKYQTSKKTNFTVDLIIIMVRVITKVIGWLGTQPCMKPYTQTHNMHICMAYMQLSAINSHMVNVQMLCNQVFVAIHMNYIIANIISVTHTVHSQYGIKNILYYGLVNTCVYIQYMKVILWFSQFFTQS